MRYNESYQFPFAAYPALRIMLLLMAGICLGYVYSPSLKIAFMLFGSSVFLWLLFEFLIRRKWPVTGGYSATVFYLFIIATSSLCLYTISEIDEKEVTELSEILQLFEWEEAEIIGRVENTGRSGTGRNVFEIAVNETVLPENVIWNQKYKLRLYGDHDQEDNVPAGSNIQAQIRFYSFPDRRNPHEFDYGNWLINQGFSAHGELVSLIDVNEKNVLGWETLRAAVQNNTDKIFDGEYSNLAKALLLGYKEDLTPETRQHFARAGLSHIMAVSGLHVGFLVAPFWFFIPYMWGSRKGKWIGIIVLSTILLGYAGLTGFSPSVSRASLMAWLLTYGKLFHKVRNSINLTAVAAIIILAINPRQLFDVGFQLSFAAVFIILMLMPEVQRLIPNKYRFGFFGGLITVILVSFVVQLGLFPILTRYFGEFSIIGPAANALVVPLLSLTVPAGLIFIFIAPLLPEVFLAVAIPIQYSLEWIHQVANQLGGQWFSFITIHQTPTALFFVWLFAILFFASVRIAQYRWKLLAAFLFSFSFLFIELSLQKSANLEMKITVLDVGQGDAIHVRTPKGKQILIDAGRWSPMSNSGERVLLPYFEQKGINRLDAIILSHPHADHIGGMPDLIKNLEIDAIYQSDYDYDSELYKKNMKLTRDYNIPVYYPVAGDQIEIDPSIRMFVIGPEDGGVRDRNPNNHSVAMKMVYGQTSILFSGDAEVSQERQIAERYGDFLKADLYKVGHHASNTSSTEIFMKHVEPEYSVASLAFQNRFGHPGSDAVTRLNQYSKKQKYTSLKGALRFKTDGSSLSRVDWRKN